MASFTTWHNTQHNVSSFDAQPWISCEIVYKYQELGNVLIFGYNSWIFPQSTGFRSSDSHFVRMIKIFWKISPMTYDGGVGFGFFPVRGFWGALVYGWLDQAAAAVAA